MESAGGLRVTTVGFDWYPEIQKFPAGRRVGYMYEWRNQKGVGCGAYPGIELQPPLPPLALDGP